MATVAEAPADSVPTLMLAPRAVVAPDTSEMVTATDWAVAVPRLATASWSVVVPLVFKMALPS